MTDKSPFVVRTATWSKDEAAIRRVRYDVFVIEQAIPESEDIDQHDPVCVHAVAWAASADVQVAIGTGRLLSEGKIGRMAVVPAWRGQGVGQAMLKHLVEAAREHGHPAVTLAAQAHALAFYERLGFTAYGETFMDVDIPHRNMRLALG